MNDDTLFATLVLVCAVGSAGLLSGLIYFRALRLTAMLLAGRGGWLRPAALMLARIVGASVVLTLMARLGAAALLAGFVGFLLARMIALRLPWRAG